ncbi:hypothetical protein BZA77DRAFT_55643 [Pyronema omphalodes]|nr:hypothetical protein BZA77DRAFT_55643 [Pyronema omphalodes]
MATARAILRLPATRVAAGSTRNLLLPQIRYKSDSGQQASPPSVGGANDYQFGPANDIQPQPSTQSVSETSKDRAEKNEKSRKNSDDKEKSDWKEEAKGTEESTRGDDTGQKGHAGREADAKKGTGWKAFESAATTTASLAILGIAGYGYHKYYKHLVFSKIDKAFHIGDPALDLASASHGNSNDPWIDLKQQERINNIVHGDESGHYYLLIGEKGTGKTSMLLTAMHRNAGERVSMMEAHADPEIFRLRLGKALDFEFHEDYVGSLFSIRGPRETTALLDIERAFNKLEKVALKRRRKTGKPLVMIINGMHMVHDDEMGRNLVELLQQRAEGWAAAGLVTMVFNSDDYWVYERMKQYGSRMELISVKDLSKAKSIEALRVLRKRKFPHRLEEDEKLFDKVYERVGGRLAYLTKVANTENMLKQCENINEIEKTWLLNKCWILGEGMDDDVMDQQKRASSAMLLVKALVDEDNKARASGNYDPSAGHQLPCLPLHKAREVMTRADFIQEYDHDNIFTIDSKANVRADSVPMMNAFRDICAIENFDEYLEQTLARIADIESLGRTREVTLKDLWNGGKYSIKTVDSEGNISKSLIFDVERGRKGINGDDGDGNEGKGEGKE